MIPNEKKSKHEEEFGDSDYHVPEYIHVTVTDPITHEVRLSCPPASIPSPAADCVTSVPAPMLADLIG
jgi:hypothetical protein